MNNLSWIFILSVLLLVPNAQAERPPLDPKNSIQFIYGDREYNSSPTQYDMMLMVLKEGDTGRVRTIRLAETEKDSSIFSATVTLQDWQDLLQIYPEIYVSARANQVDVQKTEDFIQKVKSKSLQRRPTIFKQHENGMQIVQVYKNRADMTQDLLRQQNEMQQEVVNNQFEEALRQKFPDQVLIDQSTNQEKVQYLVQISKNEIERQARRPRKRQELEKDLLEKRKAFQFLPEQQKKMNRAVAGVAFQNGKKSYEKNDFKNALTAFQDSLLKDPNSPEVLFYNGMALFRLNRFDDAIVYFQLADVKSNLTMERDFYIALSHYKLEELNRALILFRDIKGKGDPTLGPSAAYQEGLILFSQEKFIEAQQVFEEVIRTSVDPFLDENAERYLDDIAWKISFKKNKAQKWFLDLKLEEIYDTNILFATDNKEEQGLSGLPNEREGFRTQLLGHLGRRILYDEHREMSLKLSSNYMYSSDSTFKRADPFVAEFQAPYVHKGTAWGKTLQSTVTPRFESLFMDAENEGERVNIQDKAQIDADFTYGMRSDLLSTYSMSVASIDSKLDDLTGRDNADAAVYSLGTSQNLYLDRFKKSAVIPKASVYYNMADGENKTYNRVDLGLTYLNSKWLQTSWYANLNYYLLEFPDHDENRSDKNTSVKLGFNRVLLSSWSWGMDVVQAKNMSNVTANDYTKTTAALSLSYQWAK